jgi:hypothetical protein
MSPTNRIRAITAAVAGASIGLAVLWLFVTDSILALGYLPGMAALLTGATVAVAARRAEEAVATRSPLRWAWGSAWRSWLIAALASGVILGIILARSAVFWPPSSGGDVGAPSAEDAGMQVAMTVAFFYAPLPLLLGTAAHLMAALAVRRAVRRRWSWFAT